MSIDRERHKHPQSTNLTPHFCFYATLPVRIRPDTLRISLFTAMATPTLNPVEVGARGTIASLMSREIEYLRRMKLDHDFAKHKQYREEGNPPSSNSGYNSVKKKKKDKQVATATATDGRFLPSMCSTVDVAHQVKVEKMAGVRYQNLRAHAKGLEE